MSSSSPNGLSGQLAIPLCIAHPLQKLTQPLLDCGLVASEVGKRDAVFVPQPLDEPHQLLPLLDHGGIEAGLHVLSEEFEDEDALLVAVHHAATGLEFIHEGVGELTVAGAGGGKVGLDLLVGSEFGFNSSETVEHRLERSSGCI